MTSAGLVHLKDLTNLQFLNVCLTAVDDEGLSHLGKLTKIKRMTVCASKITGSGFAHLGGMRANRVDQSAFLARQRRWPRGDRQADQPAAAGNRAYERHRCRAGAHRKSCQPAATAHPRPGATEAALPFVGKLQQLYELDIYDRPASNQALAEIGKLPKLRFLRLFGGTFDDVGVAHLAGLTTLEELVLGSGQVTDASMEHLAGLTNLRAIHLAGTKITPAGKQRLQELLPKVVITP